jgi:hypothetical protein
VTFRFDDQHRDELRGILRRGKVPASSIDSTVDALQGWCARAVTMTTVLSVATHDRKTMREDIKRLILEEPDHPMVASGLAKLLAGVKLPKGLLPNHRRQHFVCAVRYTLVRAGVKNSASSRSCLVQALDCMLRATDAFPSSQHSARDLLRAVADVPLFPLPFGRSLSVHVDDLQRTDSI